MLLTNAISRKKFQEQVVMSAFLTHNFSALRINNNNNNNNNINNNKILLLNANY